ncbi:MAG: hypothetical protein ABI233_11345, partial [Chthoniobacterales bacterium]
VLDESHPVASALLPFHLCDKRRFLLEVRAQLPHDRETTRDFLFCFCFHYFHCIGLGLFLRFRFYGSDA